MQDAINVLKDELEIVVKMLNDDIEYLKTCPSLLRNAVYKRIQERTKTMKNIQESIKILNTKQNENN
jgi:hypothetical protein